MLATHMNPAGRAAAITPHDSNGFEVCDALYVGVAGDAVVVFEDGTQVTLTGLQAGAVYPFRITRVNSTSTTATDMVALYSRPAKVS